MLLPPEYDPDAGGVVGAHGQPHGRDGGEHGQLVDWRQSQRCGYVVPVWLVRTGATVNRHVRLPRGVLRLPPDEVVVEGVHGGGGQVVSHYHAPRAPGERVVVG